MSDKKSDPTYIRLTQSNKERVVELAKKLGRPGRELPESDLIDQMVALGLDTYDFYQSHFGIFPVGFNPRIVSGKNEHDDC